MRLGILASHPIQYQAPWFRALTREVELEVFFAHRPDVAQQGEGFGKSFSWDLDLLSGYRHHFLKNISPRPSPSRFFGCDTPEIANIISGKHELEDGRWKMEDGKNAPTPNFQLPAFKPFDVFIVCGWHLKSYWQAVRACRRMGIPVLVRGDSQLMTPRSRLKTWIKEIGYRLMLRQFDGFLVVGQRNREYLAHYGVPAEKMFFAPHFVDNEWFAARAAEARNQKSETRKKWGIPTDAFCVLFCGKFISKKRPLDLVEAARLLLIQNSKFKISLQKNCIYCLWAAENWARNFGNFAASFLTPNLPTLNPQPSTLNLQPSTSRRFLRRFSQPVGTSGGLCGGGCVGFALRRWRDLGLGGE